MDDSGSVAAQFKQHTLKPSYRRNPLPGGLASGEAHHVNLGMSHQLFSYRGVPVDDVEPADRHTAAVKDLSQHHGYAGAAQVRLQHNCVAGSNGRRDLVANRIEWGVKWSNSRNHPYGITSRDGDAPFAPGRC